MAAIARLRIAALVACFAAAAGYGCATVSPGSAEGAEAVAPSIPIPGTAGAQRTPVLSAIPMRDGELALEVGYPSEGAALSVRASNFIFGSTGSGRSLLTINGTAVDVQPNGGFLAFVPVPSDGVYRLRAERDGVATTLERTVTLPPLPASPPEGIGIIAGSGYPSGALAAAPGEPVEIGFRGTAGGTAWLALPGGERVPLVQAGAPDPRSTPGDAFVAGRPAGAPTSVDGVVRYVGILPARPLVSGDASISRPSVGEQGAATGEARFELIVGTDTVRAPFPLNLHTVPDARPRVAVATPPEGAAQDWRARGRNDIAGPYHYFWPEGTVLSVTGERNGMLRVRLGPDRVAWVPAGELQLLADGAPPPSAAVGDVRLYPEATHIDVRLPMAARLPFEVVVEGDVIHLDVFGAVSRSNFFQYGRLDPLVERAGWSQPANHVYRVSVWLTSPAWGFDSFFDSTGSIVLRIRRPPRIDPAAPLRNLRVVVDAGHGGGDRATRGPTGFTEADANLAVSLALRELLEERGAEVVMTRTDDETVPLGDRPRIATEADGHLLVSVHNNAFPDGVDPWANHGTSVYYFHPQSAELARWLQLELLDELGTRDLGIGRADLALVRPSWMPAVLSETLFMMIPEHEAALADPTVQRRIAAAHVRALEAFAASRAGR
jgi:N-acetylmuramoyl-L-alanine amidase